MDPNANLMEQLSIARADWTGKDTEELTPSELSVLHAEHIRLCDLVESLDQWITNVGYLPERWQRSR
jgi:hypothetical protein